MNIFKLKTVKEKKMIKHFAKLLIVPLAIGLVPLHATAKGPKADNYVATMAPLNDSGVWASVDISIKGKTLTVSIEASGLEAGKPHPQHIHGSDNSKINATCPGLDADVNGDGVISVGEGLPSYGPIILPLFPFDLVDAAGNLSYTTTVTINPKSLKPFHKRTVVMHGLSVGGSYVPSLPVACGQIEEVE